MAERLTVSALLARLQACVSPAEWERLADDGSGLVIGAYNRETLLEMRDDRGGDDSPLDAVRVRGLAQNLTDYLQVYMADRPEGHKWIILSSLYSTFVRRLPMHPVEVVHIETVICGGRTVYYCPCKSPGTDTACAWCVCRARSERPDS